MFGQTGNASFSGFNTATQTSPFGQSAFGKPITTTSFGSGTTPVFGSGNTLLFSSKPTGSTTGGLFGNTATPPAFRQPTNTQPSFGGFGTANTNTNPFGAQQNAGTSLFGTNTATSAFGQANKPAGFSFGTTSGTNFFGQPQQPAQQSTPFGQPNATTNTNLFSTTPGFGSTSTTTGVTGTVVKFQPVITTDSMSKNGISHNISARHCCIASMKEYESKSYEELRFEDYSVGRKGPSTGLFGTPAQPSPFGSAGAGTSTAGTGFGAMSGGFGTTSQSVTNSLFGKPLTSFGAPSTTATNSFPFNSTPTTNLFCSNTQTKPFGTAAPTPLFATSNTNQTAGTGFGGINTAQNTGFGPAFASTQPNQSIGLFNQNKSAFNVPSTSSGGGGFTGFSQTASSGTGPSLFGAKTAGSTGFGGTSTFGQTATSSFGNTTGFTAGQTSSGSSLFNSSFKPAGQASGFSFGSTTVPPAGGNTSLSLGSGSTLFGQQKPGGLFGNTGSNTTFSNPGSFGASTFGTGTGVMSGMGTGLLTNGLPGNQPKNTGSIPVHQQILALVSAPFGDSPLLKNLLPASGKTEELLKPTNAASRMLQSPQYKVTANNKSPKIKARVVSAVQLSKKSLFEGLEEEDPVLSEAFQPRPNAKRLVLRPKPTTDSTPTHQSALENSGQGIVSKTITVNEENFESTDFYKNNQVEATNKENDSRENNRQVGNDRGSSASWLKSTLPRKSKFPDDESFEGQRSPFSEANISNETISNTVAELRSHVVNSNQKQQSDGTTNRNVVDTSGNLSFADKSCTDVGTTNTDSSQELDENSFSLLQSSRNANAAKVTLRRVGYYTIPSLDKLDDYVCGETCIVPNFTVGREGYGNVFFPDSFDVYGLNLDEIVHFRHKEVIIYPDDDKKPGINQGLNRRAQVTLDRVWPHDKSLHEPITDPHRLTAMNYEGKLRRVSAKHDTRFLEYRPETGSWVFKVEHFSKYGLSDSDEDENGGTAPAVDPKKMKGKSAASLSNTATPLDRSKVGKETVPNGMPNDVRPKDARRAEVEAHLSVEQPLLSRRSLAGREYLEQKRFPLSPTGDNARITGTDSHKLQLMKASFFDSDLDDVARGRRSSSPYFPDMEAFNEEDYAQIEGTYDPILRSSSTMIRRTPLVSKVKEGMTQKAVGKADTGAKKSLEDKGTKFSFVDSSLPEPKVAPVTTILKCHSEAIPLDESMVNKLEFRCVADAGIKMGRMFKAGWGFGLTLLSLSTQDQAAKMPLHNAFAHLGSYVSGRLFGDGTSSSVVQRLQILGGEAADEERTRAFTESIEGHLRIQLANREMGQEGDCPILDVATDTASVALHAHSSLARELVDHAAMDSSVAYANNVWKMCVALWGDLSDANVTTRGNAEQHCNAMARREALGEWLKCVVRDTVEREIVDEGSDEKIILSLLSASKLEEACEIARNLGDHCLALLMSQLRSGMPVKELIRQQLASWQEADVDENLSIERLKLFTLAAGEPMISSKHGTINVCENLDWKRAFAVHLWFLSSPTASIRDTLELYEKSFRGSTAEVYAAAPVPAYRETTTHEAEYEVEPTNGKPIYDLCYHLLKLYCTGNHGLGELLNPWTHTADPLDYRLSWLMQQVLIALGYSHLSDHVAALTHVNFSTQLEAFGLWHWAIFVVLHLRDVKRRRAAVMDLLQRHVEISEDSSEYAQREQFLREELGIPSTWLHRAKAIKSYSSKRYGEAAWYFIQAEEWNMAHEIIIQHLAADAIINENYEYLKSLLSPLVPVECSGGINEWQNQGSLLWDYMEVTMDVKSLLQATDPRGISYKLESLKPRLTSLCFKINQFPCPTAKHRLCQAEIAKRTLHLARNLLLSQSTDSRSTTKTLVHLVSQLPLPEDYAQQELRPIVNMCVNEAISQTA